MLARRVTDSHRTLNDMVEEIHTALYDKPVYRSLIMAVWDSEAVEGSLAADNHMAAQMIRSEAKTRNQHELAGKNLATISKSLGVVLRRFELDRKTRRHMVEGVVVAGTDGNGDAN